MGEEMTIEKCLYQTQQAAMLLVADNDRLRIELDESRRLLGELNKRVIDLMLMNNAGYVEECKP